MDSKKTFSKLLELNELQSTKITDLENGVLIYKKNQNPHPPYSTKRTPPTVSLYGLDLVKKIIK